MKQEDISNQFKRNVKNIIVSNLLILGGAGLHAYFHNFFLSIVGACIVLIGGLLDLEGLKCPVCNSKLPYKILFKKSKVCSKCGSNLNPKV